jgi:hypothetical protein
MPSPDAAFASSSAYSSSHLPDGMRDAAAGGSIRPSAR